MKKVIVMSVRPEYLVDILNGRKTIEIRKSVPKELPIEVYLYCTKARPKLFDNRLFGNDDSQFVTSEFMMKQMLDDFDRPLNGSIVAKFTLKEVEVIQCEDIIVRADKDSSEYEWYSNSGLNQDELLEKTFLSLNQLDDYLIEEKGYALHISELETFDKPMGLGEMLIAKRKPVKESNGYWKPSLYADMVDGEAHLIYQLKRPPQSWQYAWVKGE